LAWSGFLGGGWGGMGKAADQVRHQAGSVAPELIYRFAAQATGFPTGVVMKLDECSVFRGGWVHGGLR
jgi:hypothetical protein